MLRLVGKDGKLNINCNKLYEFETGIEVDPTKYEILKAGQYLSITDIDTKDNTFKVGLEQITVVDPDTLEETIVDGDPLCELNLGEMIYIKTSKFDAEADIINKNGNLYQINKKFTDNIGSVDAELKGNIKRIKDDLTLIDLDEGIYFTDTGYIIIVDITFSELMRVSFSDVFAIDSIADKAIPRWKLQLLIDRAYGLVMDDLQRFKDDFIEQHKYLDIDNILALQAYKVLSLYEYTTQEPSYKYSRMYESMMKSYQPTYSKSKDGGVEKSRLYKKSF